MDKKSFYPFLALLSVLLYGCVETTVEPTDLVEPSLVPYKTPTATTNPAITLEALVEPTRMDPTPTPWVHIVQENDTLLGIANRYGVSLDDLLLANPDIDPRLLTIDQEIIIPGPEGDAGPVVLPTPTPLPLAISPVSCFPSPSGGLWCILSVINTTSDNIEGISVVISLLDSAGDVLQSEPAYSPHNILPPGAKMPMAIQFSLSPQENFTPVGRQLSAIRSGEISARYSLPGVENVDSDRSADGRQIVITGTIVLTGLEEGTTVHLSLLAMGLDADDQVVGYTKWVLDDLTGDQSVPFEVTIISLGPEIVDYEILVEGRLDSGS
jgi:LysM repeat protein